MNENISEDKIQKLKNNEKINQYQKYQNTFYLISIFFTPALLLLVVIIPVSSFFYEIAERLVDNYYLVLSLYAIVFSLAFKIVFLPYDYYKDYIIEKKFDLSNETPAGFLKDELKQFVLGIIFALFIINALYYFIKNTGEYWWLVLAGFMVVFNIILARLYPVLIMPIFNKFTPLEDEELKKRLKNLFEKQNLKPAGFFVMDMSKRTKKANAFFTGLGKSKRVVLADTLLEKYNYDEIELILAHEIGHYKKKHLYYGMLLSVLITVAGLFVCHISLKELFPVFGYESLSAIQAFPLIALVLNLFFLVLTPFQNLISRVFEYQADSMAVKLKPDLDVFKKVFYKLSEQNLNDVDPPEFIKIMRYSHPPVKERIAHAEKVLQ